MTNLAFQGFYTEEQFNQLQQDFICKLEGIVRDHDILYKSDFTNNIDYINKQFYNEVDEEVNFIYREINNDNSKYYEVYFIEDIEE